MTRLLIAWLCVFAPLLAQAGPGQVALDRFFAEVDSFRAEFMQTVLDPNLQTLATSEGQVYIRRPGQFRWDYTPPDNQQIIGDGEQVWVYDIDLEQVTVRPQQTALGESVALLLAGDGQLSENYEVVELGRQGAYHWVEITPHATDNHFASLRLGFAEGQLRAMEMLDQIEQRSRILLRAVIENPTLIPGLFQFQPPPGVEVFQVSE